MKTSLLVFLLFFSCLSKADLAVVSHADSEIPEVALPVIKSLYTGNLKYLNGQRVLPLDQMQGNTERELFYAHVFDIPMSQIVAQWSRLIFTGKGQSPIQAANSGAVFDLVRNNKNMIGYIPFENVTPDVRVIFRIKTGD